MKETGIVKDICGDMCHVVVMRKSACGESCASCSGGCKLQNQICLAKNLVSAVPGDRVEIEIDTKTVLKSAFLVYILPVFAFIVAFLLAQPLSELVAGIIASATFICIFVLLFVLDKHRKNECISRVTQILEK